LIKAGEKVTSSHVALLGKLNINPFFYGIKVTHVYESGTVYGAEVLDLTKEDLYAKFFGGVRKIAALSLAIGYPTIASVPHVLGGAFRKLLYISSAAGYEFKEAKAFLEAAAAGGGGGGGGGDGGGETKEVKKPGGGGGGAPGGGGGAPGKKPKVEAKPKVEEKEPEEEGDDGGGMGSLFGGPDE